MQNYCKTIGALAAASALVAGNASAGTSAPTSAPVSAPESAISYELHAGYSSEYLFRGLDLGDDLVEVGLDAAYTMDKLTFSGGVWAAAFDSSAATGNDTDNEVDWYAETSYDFGFMTAAVGYIYYWNVASLGDDFQELYVSASHDFGFAEAYLTWFWDIDGDNDGYTEAGLTRSWELNQCLTLNLGTNVGYLVEQGQCTAWTTKTSLDWAFVENAKLSPFMALSFALSDDNDTFYAGSGNEFVAGSMLSVSF